MIIELYDDRLGKLLQTWFKDELTELVTLNTDILFVPEVNALQYRSERKGATVLDFISFYRISQDYSWARQTTRGAREGIYSKLPDSTKMFRHRVIPVDLMYEVIYWSVEKRKKNIFEKEYYFWLQEDPNLKFTLASGHELEVDMHFGNITEEVTDWFMKGRYFKAKGNITLDAWLAKDMDVKDIKSIMLDIYTGGFTPATSKLDSRQILT